jgi:hypothetical protein
LTAPFAGWKCLIKCRFAGKARYLAELDGGFPIADGIGLRELARA